MVCLTTTQAYGKDGDEVASRLMGFVTRSWLPTCATSGRIGRWKLTLGGLEEAPGPDVGEPPRTMTQTIGQPCLIKKAC